MGSIPTRSDDAGLVYNVDMTKYRSLKEHGISTAPNKSTGHPGSHYNAAKRAMIDSKAARAGYDNDELFRKLCDCSEFAGYIEIFENEIIATEKGLDHVNGQEKAWHDIAVYMDANVV